MVGCRRWIHRAFAGRDHLLAQRQRPASDRKPGPQPEDHRWPVAPGVHVGGTAAGCRCQLRHGECVPVCLQLRGRAQHHASRIPDGVGRRPRTRLVHVRAALRLSSDRERARPQRSRHRQLLHFRLHRHHREREHDGGGDAGGERRQAGLRHDRRHPARCHLLAQAAGWLGGGIQGEERRQRDLVDRPDIQFRGRTRIDPCGSARSGHRCVCLRQVRVRAGDHLSGKRWNGQLHGAFHRQLRVAAGHHDLVDHAGEERHRRTADRGDRADHRPDRRHRAPSAEVAGAGRGRAGEVVLQGGRGHGLDQRDGADLPERPFQRVGRLPDGGHRLRRTRPVRLQAGVCRCSHRQPARARVAHDRQAHRRAAP